MAGQDNNGFVEFFKKRNTTNSLTPSLETPFGASGKDGPSLSEGLSPDTAPELLGINASDDPTHPALPFFTKRQDQSHQASSIASGDANIDYDYPEAIRQQLREYAKASGPADENSRSWKCRPEIATSDEVLDNLPDWQGLDEDGNIVLDVNKPFGAWESKESYIHAHYELLREEAVRPLREAVSFVKRFPRAMEADAGRNHNLGLYDKVHICGATMSLRGIAIRVSFSLNRVGKNVHWEQSSRLITGSIVALSPIKDAFQTKCVVAVVASRKTDRLKESPPKIDLFFARPDELEIDPDQEWLMVEERTGFYEAQRHTMTALHKMMKEPLFPFSEHLIDVEKNVSAPEYIAKQPLYNMSDVFQASLTHNTESMNVLEDWPKDVRTDLDDSQQLALKRILTKRLAIIQGPPGTGKTFVSVEALKILLSAMKPTDPPIIVACQTNHALDQLLRHIAMVEPSFARLGGRSKDTDLIKSRTLFNLRQDKKFRKFKVRGGLREPARHSLKQLETRLLSLLSPLDAETGFIDQRMLCKLDILTKEQCESLERGDGGWTGQTAAELETDEPLLKWLHKHAVENDYYNDGDFRWHEYEDEPLEFEKLKEREAENAISDDDKLDNLFGTFIGLSQQWRGQQLADLQDTKAEALLQRQDMWKITNRQRGPLFNWMMRQAKQRILEGVRDLTVKYADAVRKYQVGGWERDVALLRKVKIIGMTTTGLCKNRAVVDALNPVTVLIEEAAESLEAPITAACVQSLEHLILVGDHRQLRPQCAIKDLEGEPVHLNVSLFERMVNNEIEFSQLQRQRRMIPEVRRLLRPIYGNTITDHPAVLDPLVRPPVPGMGGVNSYFLTHEYEETKDAYLSTTNPQEANMVVGFFEYLVDNGVDPENITVLTFYNGQRKLIHNKLRARPGISGLRFNVVTVDSYQGEENDVILLSLVRSNSRGIIGFVGIENRICVALSRSKLGCYMFGNMDLLVDASPTWEDVAKIMSGKAREKPSVGPKCRIGERLPIVCQKHGKQTLIKDPSDWDALNGGCDQRCGETLPCGHACDLKCHPFGNDMVNCFHSCPKELSCGHMCSNKCFQACCCNKCTLTTNEVGNEDDQTNTDTKQNYGRLRSKERNSSAPPSNQSVNGKRATYQEPSQLQSHQSPVATISKTTALHYFSQQPANGSRVTRGNGHDARQDATKFATTASQAAVKRTTPGEWEEFANGGVYEHDKQLDRMRSSRSSPEKKAENPGTTPSRVTKAIGNGRFQWTDTYPAQTAAKQGLPQGLQNDNVPRSPPGPSAPVIHPPVIMQHGGLMPIPTRKSGDQSLNEPELPLIDFDHHDELIPEAVNTENAPPSILRHSSTPLVGRSLATTRNEPLVETTTTPGPPRSSRAPAVDGINSLRTVSNQSYYLAPRVHIPGSRNQSSTEEDLMSFNTSDSATVTDSRHLKQEAQVSILDLDD